jgi:hypothetical protein
MAGGSQQLFPCGESCLAASGTPLEGFVLELEWPPPPAIPTKTSCASTSPVSHLDARSGDLVLSSDGLLSSPGGTSTSPLVAAPMLCGPDALPVVGDGYVPSFPLPHLEDGLSWSRGQPAAWC